MDTEAGHGIGSRGDKVACGGHLGADGDVYQTGLGMSIAEGKEIVANIQTQMVSDQVDQHNKALTACRFCGKRVRTKEYYKSVFRSVFGKVPMRVRRVWGCDCRGVLGRTFSSLPTENLSVNSVELGTRWQIAGSRGCNLGEDAIQDGTDQVVDGIGGVVGEGGTTGSRQAAAAWPAVSAQARSWA